MAPPVPVLCSSLETACARNSWNMLKAGISEQKRLGNGSTCAT